MKKQFVVDPLISKKQQLLLACQLTRQILKIDDCVFLLPSLLLPSLRNLETSVVVIVHGLAFRVFEHAALTFPSPQPQIINGGGEEY